MNFQDQPMLIALVAVQFFVHALGWSMSARLSRGWAAPEGQFAAFWLALAVGLMLYVPAWASGHPLRNLGNLLIVGAVALQHRGMALHWGQPTRDRAYLGLVGVLGLLVWASLGQPAGHTWRVAGVCVGVALSLLATVQLIWRHGQAATPGFARFLGTVYALLALALLVRAVIALAGAGPHKVSIDAPGAGSLALVIGVMFVGGCMNLAQIRLVLGRVLDRLQSQAHTDALTGAVNRRGLLQSIESLHERALRAGQVYGVLMVDIDHFKAVNDRHGHAGGDRVLQRVAAALREGLRVGDTVARWGGEEFCVLLPRMGLADAQALAERLALLVAAGAEPRVTISVGVAQAQADQESAEDVIRRADVALYRAKESGRNRVVADATVPPSTPAAFALRRGAPG
jgi:diguanylate cyclase (GGDEF)-like protein